MQIRSAMDRKWEGFDARRGEEKIKKMCFFGGGGLANARGARLCEGGGGAYASLPCLLALMPFGLYAFWCLLP